MSLALLNDTLHYDTSKGVLSVLLSQVTGIKPESEKSHFNGLSLVTPPCAHPAGDVGTFLSHALLSRPLPKLWASGGWPDANGDHRLVSDPDLLVTPMVDGAQESVFWLQWRTLLTLFRRQVSLFHSSGSLVSGFLPGLFPCLDSFPLGN